MRFTRGPGLAAAAFGAVLAVGCAAPTTYDWAEYDGSVHRLLVTQDGFDPAGETQRLSTAVEASAQRNRPIAPGVRAHIGYLCFLSGDVAAGVANFEAEKAAYPESAVFIDGMLSRMKK